jgi:hypothetical protein
MSWRLEDCRNCLYEENVRRHLGHCLDVAADEEEAKRSIEERVTVVEGFIMDMRCAPKKEVCVVYRVLLLILRRGVVDGW